MRFRRFKSADAPFPPLYESVGVLHMHTVHSDGTGTIPEIATYAEQLGMDWLLITDHNYLHAREEGEEGKHGRINVLVGSELGEEFGNNHYLAFDLKTIPENQIDPEVYVKHVNDEGGFGAIAHPHEKRDEFPDMPPYPWTAWDVEIDGIEIWNQLSQWVEGLTRSNRYRRFLHPLKSLTRPDPETLAVWDRLNKKKRVVGYVGVDAHSLKYPILKGLFHVKVFHYKVQFRSLRTHLLLKNPLHKSDFEIARRQILDALRNGRHFGANHRQGNANGFRFYAVQDGKRYLPADRIEPGKPVEFCARSPLHADLVLLCDGKEIIRVYGKRLTFKTTAPGVWRIEAHRHKRGWIYSNPIRILP